MNNPQKQTPVPRDEIKLEDEPGMAERFQRGLRKALSTPPKRRRKPPKKVDDEKGRSKLSAT